VIALTHMRWPNHILLAERVSEIDLILGGHDHDFTVKNVCVTCSFVIFVMYLLCESKHFSNTLVKWIAGKCYSILIWYFIITLQLFIITFQLFS